MITEIETYFTKGCGRCPRFATPDCSTRRWEEGLGALRRICLGSGLEETLRWAHPCYRHAGRNIAILGAFRADYRITFFDAALLADPAGILERQGPNSRQADAIRFTDNTGPSAMAPLVSAYLAEAMSHAAAGRRPPREAPAADLPEELVAALAADPGLAAAFRTLTPGRQRSHVLHIAAAKAPATRTARIARLRSRILAGKGATER